MIIPQFLANITLIQVLIIIFALFAWSRAMLRLKSNNISIGEFSFWSMLWIIVILVSLFPVLIGRLSEIAGVGRAVDMVVYVSIIILFYLIFRLYVFIDSRNTEVTTLVRELAIRDARHNNSVNMAKKRNIIGRNKKSGAHEKK